MTQARYGRGLHSETKEPEQHQGLVFLRLLKSRTQPVLGVDIGSAAVKLVELHQDGGAYRIRSHGLEPLPPHAVADARIADENAVAGAVARIVKRCAIRTKQAAAAVPGSAAISKVLTVPNAPNDAEMESQIQLEADRQLPFPVEEVHFDFEVLGPCGNDPERVDVMLAATRRENVTTRAAVLRRAGLKPRIVDVEPYALEHVFPLLADCVPDAGAGKTVAMVDMGAATTLLAILHDRKIVYTREQPFGDRPLTRDIMRRCGLSYEAAERMKRTGGSPDKDAADDGPAAILASFKDAMARQIDRALRYFLSSTGYAHVDQVMLAGGNACLPGMDAAVHAQTGVPARVADPFAAMPAAGPVADGPAMLIAAGLAMRGCMRGPGR